MSSKTELIAHQQRPLNNCRPSADYLFSSAARIHGAGTLALVMTGMGVDGLNGARRVHEAGGVVLAQDQATSVVWGMPGSVVAAGLARRPLPLAEIARELNVRVNAGRPRTASTESAIPAQATRTTPAPQREEIHGLL